MLGPNKRYFFCVYPPVSRDGNDAPADLYHVSRSRRQIVVIDDDTGDGGGDNNWVIVDYQISGLGSGKRNLTIVHCQPTADCLVSIRLRVEQHILIHTIRILWVFHLSIEHRRVLGFFFSFCIGGEVFLIRLSSAPEKSRRRDVYSPGTTISKSLLFR